MIWILIIILFFILYWVIYFAVKEGIDNSEVGQLLIKKYGDQKEIQPVSDEEIEKELEDEFKREEN